MYEAKLATLLMQTSKFRRMSKSVGYGIAMSLVRELNLQYPIVLFLLGSEQTFATIRLRFVRPLL